LTSEDPTDDGDLVLNLQALIRMRKDERGWSFVELESRSNNDLTRGRWQQLAAGERIRNFPGPDTIRVIADALEVDVTTVLMAAARSLGLAVRPRGPDLAQLLPAGTDLLSERMRDAILVIIRAAVAEHLAAGEDPGRLGEVDGTFEWGEGRRPASPSRNASAGVVDNPA
jgi:hypothetical protein